ncbi:hypothetical protein MTO96_020270 [Rhipicephalus appendiculatus]
MTKKYFPHPEVFDPDRFLDKNKEGVVPFSFLPFGEGPRQCVGMKFASMNFKLGLFHALSRFSFETCPETEVSFLMLKCHHRMGHLWYAPVLEGEGHRHRLRQCRRRAPHRRSVNEVAPIIYDGRHEPVGPTVLGGVDERDQFLITGDGLEERGRPRPASANIVLWVHVVRDWRDHDGLPRLRVERAPPLPDGSGIGAESPQDPPPRRRGREPDDI